MNMHDLLISADMPAAEVDASEVKRKCMEALDRAMDYIKGDPIDAANFEPSLFIMGGADARNSG